MTLEFEKLIPQIERMGRFVAHRSEDLSQRGQAALDLFADATDIEEIWRKIELARQNDAGYRGAAPCGDSINQYYECPPAPERALIIAADGSQVYPDQHLSALYYLTNVGVFTYHHGEDRLPEQFSDPQLFYQDADLRDLSGQVIKNTAVNARRTIQEMQVLAKKCRESAVTDMPLVALRDGPLLFWLGTDVPYAEKLEGEYREALRHMHGTHQLMREHDQNLNLIGYVARNDSRFVVRLLHLLTLPDEQVKRKVLDTAGPFEGLNDDWLFGQILESGERSDVMVQQSPQNKAYRREIGDEYEIAYFYVNVSTTPKAEIVRVEIPMWIATDLQAVHEVHSLIIDQSRITGNYPYALTRADELAVVKGYEKHHLEEQITVALIKNRQDVVPSSKQLRKDQARGPRRRYGQPS